MAVAGRPTSKDVAQEAGVSQSTVSLVLGGKWSGRVSPATARSVRVAAERLGYRPNPAARNLRLGTTRTVLLMVPTLTAPFFGPVYTGAARVAARHGFGVVVSTWPDDAEGPAESPFPAPHEAIDGVLARHPELRTLFDKGWLHLFRLNEQGRMASRYVRFLQWTDLDASPAQNEPQEQLLRAAG